ncbi:NADP-dependent oxidoreductase [Peribacillus kribbensis]|uniref:NADP-dependent oxidoreductase n=1 Tax=Peribacillus kribbensis TaxID=356658 RepID=UPI0004293851|nr:NADP-dependent oxidoreductase [Peribacillus kribbensis]
MQNKQILLASRPVGMPDERTFEIREAAIPDLSDGEVLIRAVYVSVDPYMRGRMTDAESYIEPFPLNEVITGGVVGQIERSASPDFNEGDFVIGTLGWQEYSIAKAKEVRKIDPAAAPISTHLGILGMPGLTAYFGLLDIGKPREGETVVVSGAAGAVGSTVGQIAKIKGCRTIGIAGSDEKIRYLVEDLGFDDAINYKTTPDLRAELKEKCPDGVDIYFDNVGGEISDKVHARLNRLARVPVCGAISTYNLKERDIGPRVQTLLIKKSILMQGFTVGDYAKRFKEGAADLGKWLGEGRLKYEETVREGFENIPDAFLDLFRGKNTGKLLVKVSDPK